MAVLDAQVERRSSVALKRGLHVIRYASSGATRDFPSALVAPADGSDASVQIISAPGTREGWLERPGSALVVCAREAVKLEIGLRRAAPTGSLDASFQIDALTDDSFGAASAPAESRAADSSVKRPDLPSPSAKLAMVGHVAMRGDVTVSEDEWMAGPDSPAPIEGLGVKTQGRDRLAIELQVLVVGAQQWSIWVEDGVFAGTRGRGLSLAGVRLRLVGPDAPQAELAAEALFLGSMVQSKNGRQIEFTSSTGSEPLVGFKLSLKRHDAALGGRLSEGPWQDRGSRVRVYKSSSSGD